MVCPAGSATHSFGSLYVALVSLPSDDVVQHVPVFGMWVHPGYFDSLGFAKHGVE